MRRRFKLAFGLILALAVLAIVAFFYIHSGMQAFQRDADIVRLQHLKYYGLLIDEYHKKTGLYPFEGKFESPLYVYLANDYQVVKGGPPYKHEVVPFADFIAEIESALGRPIEEHYDPQLGAYQRPNFYIYMIHGDTYFFAVHLDRAFPFAKRIADHFYKTEISNAPTPENRAADPQLLFADPAFIAAIRTPLFKPDFFAAREKHYLHLTKQRSSP